MTTNERLAAIEAVLSNHITEMLSRMGRFETRMDAVEDNVSRIKESIGWVKPLGLAIVGLLVALMLKT